ESDGVRMMHRLGKPDRLGFVLRRLGESAELSEALDQEATIVDRCRCGASEVLVEPVGGQRREVVGGQLDYPLVLATPIMRLPEVARGGDAESQVSAARRDPQRAGAGPERS